MVHLSTVTFLNILEMAMRAVPERNMTKGSETGVVSVFSNIKHNPTNNSSKLLRVIFLIGVFLFTLVARFSSTIFVYSMVLDMQEVCRCQG